MPTALVTGSSRGIGRAIALRFARDGYDITVNYRTNSDAADAVVDQIETTTDQAAIAVQADVSNQEAASRLVAITRETFESLDHIVNNAGRDQHVYTADLSPSEFDRIMDINVNSAFNVTKAALPALMDSSVPEGPSVTNMSSVQAYTGAAIECHYASSKAAMIALTKSHARDFAPTVRVNAIAPGHIMTDMMAGDRSEAELDELREGVPLARFGEPDEIAVAAAYLRDAGFVTGETLNVNGGELMR